MPQNSSGIETKRRYHGFLSQRFCLRVSKYFVGEPICLLGKNWYRHRERVSRLTGGKFCLFSNLFGGNFLCFIMFLVSRQRRIITYFHHFFCLRVPKNFVGPPFCASENFWYRDREKVSRLFFGKFLSHSVKNFCSRTVLCFRKVLVSGQTERESITIFRRILLLQWQKSFWASHFVSRKISGNETERGYHDFLSQRFCLRVSKYFVGEPICLLGKNWYRHRERVSRLTGGKFCLFSNLFGGNFLCFIMFLASRQRKSITYFHHFFCLRVPKNFVGPPFCASENFWYRDREKVSRLFFEKLLSHSVKNFCSRTVLCFRKVLVSGQTERESITIFRRILLLQWQKSF